MKAVKFYVSEELIRQALAIPDDATILDIKKSGSSAISYEFTVIAESLPVLKEMEEPPIISPVMHADYSKRPSIWITYDWNVPKANS